jgi:inorganic triphosphatase YgiF
MIEASREFEIKLLFPLNRFKAIEQFIISKGGARRQHLQAAYIDTPDFLLSKAGIALRIRKEGRQWLQTLKIATANPLDRIEHNVVLRAQGSQLPSWSISHHQGHSAGEWLKQLIPDLANDQLAIQYQTDIWRRKVEINTVNGLVEYALDQGVILAKNPDGVKSQLVHELEIELKAGHPEDLLRHARAVVKRFKAYIDTHSKSERGYLLARNIEVSPAKRATVVHLKKSIEQAQVIDRVFDDCLSQILQNQSVINSDYQHYDEYLHQLRVGFRRLKTLLKYLAPYRIALSEAGDRALQDVFRKLGGYRDDSYISQSLNPTISSLNGPPVELESKESLPHPNVIVRGNLFQLLLLEIMSLRFSTIPATEEGQKFSQFLPYSKKLVFKRINKEFYFCANQALELSSLEDDGIHELRKKLKFLRYSLEFFKDLCEQSRFKPFFKLLTVALEHLGQFNDICVAISRIESRTQSNPQFLFALGWLKAERKRTRVLCEKSVADLFRAKPAWKIN